MQELFAPALAQFVLTFILGGLTAATRFTAGASGKVDAKTLKIGGYGWPRQVQQIGNTFNNQYESPIYFFAAVVIAMIAGETGPLVVGLAWAYFGTRVAHALIYTTVNIVVLRFSCFIIGFVVLGALWLVLAMRILGGG
ncbi:MAG: MAPEG family protein [Maricaulaceae bacterium]|jgi:hypothetical protein